MKTITENATNEIVIKNSRFIAYLYKVNSLEEISSILDNIRKEHKEATHVVYAYKVDEFEKYSDDGEPGGTAGAPVMDVLKKNDLTNVLAIVVRYFGGIKLGAGGLVRAYSKSTSEALKETVLEELVHYNFYELSTNYDNLKLLNTITKDLDIISKDFKDEIIYKIRIQQDKDNIEELFKNTDIKIKK